MNKVQEKIANRMKKNAADWYTKKIEPTRQNIIEERKQEEAEPENLENEITLITDVENVIAQSSLPEERKSIFLGSLKSSKTELMNGSVPERLPNVVRNLIQKDEIGPKIRAICDSTTNGGKSYSYLWGL